MAMFIVGGMHAAPPGSVFGLMLRAWQAPLPSGFVRMNHRLAEGNGVALALLPLHAYVSLS